MKKYNWKDKTILVAEDETINFHFIHETLIDTNAIIIWAKNGVELLEKLKTNSNIDLILLDIKMPIMNGYEVLEKIRILNLNIPIIAQTAYAFPEQENNLIIQGCNDYISKPMLPDTLLKKVALWLE